jgi:hypothetical protein
MVSTTVQPSSPRIVVCGLTLQFAGCERFVSAKHLVWLNLPLLIKKLRRKEDGDAPFEMHHNARRQPF